MTLDADALAARLSPCPIPASDEDDFARKPLATPDEAELTPSAVLIVILPRKTGARVLLTRRTDHLRDHPGQISFPGGRMEAEDASPAHTALREAQEEIGLAPDLPRILGYLPDYRTATGFLIHPAVAWLASPLDFDLDSELTLDAFEVAEVFEAPLAELFDPANHHREEIFYRGQKHSYHVIECDTEGSAKDGKTSRARRRVWGATAGMLLMLKRRLEDSPDICFYDSTGRRHQ